ncbi:MAG: FtsX-like permease family protein, partial [Acidimicrobiales bacterium]
FGLLTALITVLLVGQAVSRQVILEGDDYATLRSLGASRTQLIGLSLMRAGLVGAAGALTAVAVAAAASPLMPVGLARQAELRPGFQIDPAVLGGGAAVLAALVAAWPLRAAWKLSSHKLAAAGRELPDDAPPLRAPAALTRNMVWPSAEIGVRFGLQRGRGRTAVPVASAALAAVLAVAALVASLTFGSSLAHLESSPRQQGWNWDVLVGKPTDFTDREAQYARLLSQNPLVGSYSAVAVIAGARQGNAYIGKVALDSMLAFDQLRGSVHPTLVQGRAPRGLQEIDLGTKTLAKLHKRVGQTVAMDVGPPVGQITLRIVGAMIAPSVGDIFTNSLGDGGWISGQAFKQVQAQMTGPNAAPSEAAAPPPSSFALFAVRYAPGASPKAAFASLQRQFGPIVLRRLPPEDVINLHSVDALPLILAGLVALLGLATIGHSLVTSVRRHRRDLAVLKTVGFVRRQVGATVAWQATSFVVLALVVGLPLGVALGRWAWNLVASGINSTSPPTVPALAIGLVIPAALAVANLLAAAPGWAAARVAPALVLRVE